MLSQSIQQMHRSSRGTYGSPQIEASLVAKEFRVDRQRGFAEWQRCERSRHCGTSIITPAMKKSMILSTFRRITLKQGCSKHHQ
jgi:hypothetical protein